MTASRACPCADGKRPTAGQLAELATPPLPSPLPASAGLPLVLALLLDRYRWTAPPKPRPRRLRQALPAPHAGPGGLGPAASRPLTNRPTDQPPRHFLPPPSPAVCVREGAAWASDRPTAPPVPAGGRLLCFESSHTRRSRCCSSSTDRVKRASNDHGSQTPWHSAASASTMISPRRRTARAALSLSLPS